VDKTARNQVYNIHTKQDTSTDFKHRTFLTLPIALAGMLKY